MTGWLQTTLRYDRLMLIDPPRQVLRFAFQQADASVAKFRKLDQRHQECSSLSSDARINIGCHANHRGRPLSSSHEPVIIVVRQTFTSVVQAGSNLSTPKGPSIHLDPLHSLFSCSWRRRLNQWSLLQPSSMISVQRLLPFCGSNIQSETVASAAAPAPPAKAAARRR